MAINFNQGAILNRVNIANFTMISPVTVTLWFYITAALKNPERLFGVHDNWEVRVTNDWTADFRFTNEIYSSTAVQPPAMTSTVIQQGVWYFGAATTNVATNFQDVWLNGVVEDTGICTDVASGTTCSIGNRGDAPDSAGANCILEDVRVYTRILSAVEINAIYACRGTDTIVYGLRNRWLLNEGAEGATVTSVQDCAGGGNAVSVVGSPTYAGSLLKWHRGVC